MPVHIVRHVLLALLVAVVAGLPAPSVSADVPEAGDAAPPLPVFRSVLDGNARMLTIPLHEDLWLAYDAQTASLYKAWHGSVKLDGAVYTTVHGPQPTTVGPAYAFHPGPGTAWAGARVRFLGYRLKGRVVTLRYRLVLGRDTFTVAETPSFVRSRAGRPGLRRTFRVEGRGRGVLRLDVPVYGLSGVRTDGVVTRAGRLTHTAGGVAIPAAHAAGCVRLSAQIRTRGTTVLDTYFDPAVVAALGALDAQKAAAEVEARKQAAAAEEPAEEIAPHPKDTPVGNGVSVRIYETGVSMSVLRKLVPGQTPNVSRVLPVLDLRRERGDFGDIEDHFLTHVDGWIEVPTSGTYGFQLVSDDGSRLWIDDQVVVDHDGLHGSTAMADTVKLEAGRHKLFVEHFENAGGEQLTLSWRPPGATEWTVVPNEALRAPVGEVRVTSPGTKKLVPLATPGRPGDGAPLAGVHPSWSLAQARPDDFHPRVGGMDWLPDGRLVICGWEPEGGVYLLDGVDGDDPAQITVTRIAAGLAEPLGLRVVDGRIFVLQKQELTELIDHDGDDHIDEYRTVAAGWGVTSNFHEFAFGLAYRDGTFYAALATAIDPGGASTKPQDPDRGKVVRIWPDGRYRFIADGLRTPNGVGLGPRGGLFVTDNQGDWLPVSKMVHVAPGDFFGSHSVDPDATRGRSEKPPVVWLPQGEIGNSPGEPGTLRVGPYAGQMLHADITHGGLKRVFLERVGGALQGCVFRFTQGLEAGINRWTTGPDGALYVGGIGSSGNWGQSGKRKFGLQRLTYTGAPVFEMQRVRALRGGFRIDFTEPLAAPSGLSPDDFHVEQWRYVPTAAYGGPKKDVERLVVRGVRRSADRKSVWLDLPGLEAGRVVYLRLRRSVRSAAGRGAWSTEAWYTLNRMPRTRCPVPAATDARLANRLTKSEQAAGWRLLFDGTSLDAWRGYRRETPPAAWRAEDGTLHFSKEGEGGDLISKETWRDFELSLEWKVAEGGNSGVCYRISESGGAMWSTGPEMQVLDDDGHADGGTGKTSAGACYALFAPTLDVSRPAGAWNRARVVLRGNRLEHWLNGFRIVDTEIGGAAWQAALAASKFKDTPGYGVQPSGHIGLQDHGDKVWYRNVKIRRLPPAK